MRCSFGRKKFPKIHSKCVLPIRRWRYTPDRFEQRAVAYFAFRSVAIQTPFDETTFTVKRIALLPSWISPIIPTSIERVKRRKKLEASRDNSRDPDTDVQQGRRNQSQDPGNVRPGDAGRKVSTAVHRIKHSPGTKIVSVSFCPVRKKLF